ncbi:MAG: LPS assembly protein LptD [Candidatus Zixiibacteriota bacterium]
MPILQRICHPERSEGSAVSLFGCQNGMVGLLRWARAVALVVFLSGIGLINPRAATAQDTSPPLILEHADSTEWIHTDTASEYRLYGNVSFVHGNTSLLSDRAVWQQDVGLVAFDGNVHIAQPGLSFVARHVEYERDGQSARALGDVLIEDTTGGFALVSQRARFERGANVAVADSLPLLRWDFFLDSSDQTIIRADTITYFRDEKRGIGAGSVHVWKGDWEAQGERGEIWPDSGRALLTGKPRAVGSGGIVTGDTLILSFVERRVDRVTAIGNADGSYRDTTVALKDRGTSILRGRVADFFLSNDSLRAIRVRGQAYTDFQPDDTAQGANHASGDSLWLHFASGRLATVTIDGGAQGRYTAPRSGGGTDSVDYKAARIRFVPDSQRVDLERSGQLHYQTILLDAGRISYWTNRKNLLARPLPEPDSAGKPQQMPRLADGTQVITGQQLTYNIDSRRGRIRGSATEFEGAYYHGGDFRKYTDSVFFVTHGTYTTCNLEQPHFHFSSRDMEIIRNDKVIARPVVMRIGELPVAILPYYIFPIKRGRHSGFLPLRIGNFQRGERFIGNVGYYWAASDYYDLSGALDYNEATGVLLHGRVNYAWRYHFSGNLSGSYAHETHYSSTGTSRATRWSLVGSHQQTLSPTTTLAGNADFVSDRSYYQNYSYDPSDTRRRTVRSQLNFNKRWRGASITAYVENTENLDTDSRTRRLPQLEFSLFQRRLFAPDSGATARWYHNAYVSLSSRLSYYQSRNPTPGDTTGQFDEKRYVTVDHAAGISFPQRVIKYINVSPNASLAETWYYVASTRLARDAGIPVEEPARRMSGTMGVSASTNLYGFLNPRLWGVNAIRHTMSPRISYAFTPAVTRHDELRSFTGTGGGSSRRSQAISFSLANVLDAKLHSGDKEKKVSLLNFGLSTRYDFERDTRRWSTLAGNVRTNLVQRLDLSADATWDLYDPTTLELKWTDPRLLNFGVSAAMSLRGSASALTSVTAIGEEGRTRDTSQAGAKLPFNASFSYRYDEARALTYTSKTHWLGWRFDFSPTSNWSIHYQQTYDLAGGRITDERFEFRRDLHCWEAVFYWVPGGGHQGYYFRINVKAIPDIKIERSESGLLGAFRQY